MGKKKFLLLMVFSMMFVMNLLNSNFVDVLAGGEGDVVKFREKGMENQMIVISEPIELDLVNGILNEAARAVFMSDLNNLRLPTGDIVRWLPNATRDVRFYRDGCRENVVQRVGLSIVPGHDGRVAVLNLYYGGLLVAPSYMMVIMSGAVEGIYDVMVRVNIPGNVSDDGVVVEEMEDVEGGESGELDGEVDDGEQGDGDLGDPMENPKDGEGDVNGLDEDDSYINDLVDDVNYNDYYGYYYYASTENDSGLGDDSYINDLVDDVNYNNYYDYYYDASTGNNSGLGDDSLDNDSLGNDSLEIGPKLRDDLRLDGNLNGDESGVEEFLIDDENNSIVMSNFGDEMNSSKFFNPQTSSINVLRNIAMIMISLTGVIYFTLTKKNYTN